MITGQEKISIIIPVLNDAASLSRTLSQLNSDDIQTIVIDGGSQDDSLSIAQQHADMALVSPPGRAVQMNAGAEAATGTILLFLHADTRLPHDAISVIQQLDAESLWGRFDVSLSGSRFSFRIIEYFINLRSRLTSIATGDQAIFVERKLFSRVGGFPDIKLMEDIEISKQLKKQGPPACLKQKVVTSSRRWEQSGTLRTVLLMWKLRLLYFLGVSPDSLSRMYR